MLRGSPSGVEPFSNGIFAVRPTCMRYAYRCRRGPGVESGWREAGVEAEDVALAVFEPGGFAHAVHGGDAVVPGDAGHVVLLERHALGFEVAHLALDIVDVPLRDRVTGLAGELRSRRC